MSLDPITAISRAAQMIELTEDRVPPPADLDVECHMASVLLSAALSSDGEIFDIKVTADPAAMIDGDASTQFVPGGAAVTIATVPARVLTGNRDARLSAILLLAARSYAVEWSKEAAVDGFTPEAAEFHIAKAAIVAPRDALAAARVRLSH
jgi:hypothetical protein